MICESVEHQKHNFPLIINTWGSSNLSTIAVKTVVEFKYLSGFNAFHQFKKIFHAPLTTRSSVTHEKHCFTILTLWHLSSFKTNERRKGTKLTELNVLENHI